MSSTQSLLGAHWWLSVTGVLSGDLQSSPRCSLLSNNRCHPAFNLSAQTDTWTPLYFLSICQFLSFSSGSWLSVMVPLTSLVFQFSKTTVFCLLMVNAVKFSDPFFPPCFACSIWREDSIPVTLILTRSIHFIYSCITDWKPYFTCSLEHQLQSRGQQEEI